MALRGLFLHLFSVFSNRQTFLILALTTNGMWKIIRPVTGAGIWTHDIYNPSLFLSSLDQSSSP